MDRRWCGIVLAVVVALPLGGSRQPKGQQIEPTTRDRVMWTAEWKFESLAPPDPPRGRIGPHLKWRVRFSGEQEARQANQIGAQNGWISRRYEWEYQSYFESVGFARNPETNYRFLARFTRFCTAAGDTAIDLGPTDGMHSEGAPMARTSCVHKQFPIEPGYYQEVTRPGDHSMTLSAHSLNWPRQGCADGDARRETSPDGTVEAASWSVTVSPVVAARVQVKWGSRYAPIVGEKVELEGTATVPVHWKFELSPVSRLRGYATNADITPAFFQIYKLPKLEGHYGTLAPDLIFDPFFYEEQWQRTDWKRPYPESGPRKWSTLESAQSSNRAFVGITMMDFGAHGEVRAYVASGCGGGWVPVRISPNYDSTPGLLKLKIPEDKDGNFMADAFEKYRGLSVTDDVDPEPKGDGTPGDGFTAFEEYRGFLKQVGPICGDPLKVRHVRTDPAIKDLFIHAADPLLRDIADNFGHITSANDSDSSLTTHTICPDQYVDNDTRIVNFTMHRNPGEGIRGARLTQEEPQHGLYLVNQPAGPRLLGRSFGFGPPRNVTRVALDIPAIRAAYGSERFEEYLRLITHHELGHAVGIRHHGNGNIGGPAVLLNHPGCPIGMTGGTVGSQPVCSAAGIAIRGKQNSGNAFCPMKYIQWSWYVPPGWRLVDSGVVDFRPSTSSTWGQARPRVAYTIRPEEETLLSRPQLQRYRKDLDYPVPWEKEQLCSAATGTGVNALPMGQNHAGDATQTPSCSEQLRVNDVRVGGR
jgi:hypothetical protein